MADLKFRDGGRSELPQCNSHVMAVGNVIASNQIFCHESLFCSSYEPFLYMNAT